MTAIAITLICLPIIFLVALFIGIVKKNKRLWITSLIFLIVIIFAECALLTFNTSVRKTHSTTIQKTI